MLSKITDPNDYTGPGTGYALTEQRRAEIDEIRQAAHRRRVDRRPRRAPRPHLDHRRSRLRGRAAIRARCASGCRRRSAAQSGSRLCGLTVGEVLRQIEAGLEEEGCVPRLVRVTVDHRRRADRTDRRPAVGIWHRNRAAGQGNRADPPAGSGAAGQPGTVQRGTAADREDVPRTGQERGAGTPRGWRRCRSSPAAPTSRSRRATTPAPSPLSRLEREACEPGQPPLTVKVTRT